MLNALLVKWFGTSYRSSLFGLLGFLAGVPELVSALTAWAHHQPADWRMVMLALALAAVGAGLGNAKDKQVHSTEAQIAASTVATESSPALQGSLAAIHAELPKLTEAERAQLIVHLTGAPAAAAAPPPK